MNGRVSVVIPVRDGELYLREAIQSVLSQTYAPAEVIVVDNGSMDRSRDIASGFGASVHLLEEPIPGPAQTRNTGLRAAAGDLIAFLDADDVWEPSKLARQIEVLDRQPETDIVFTNVHDFHSPELGDESKKLLAVHADDYAGLIPSTMLARAPSFRSVGPLPEVPIGEFIAWYGLAQTAGLRSHTIPEMLVRRRVHLANTTLRHRQDKSGYLKAAKVVLDARRARGQASGS